LKAGLCPLWRTRPSCSPKWAFDVICYLHKMKQSHGLLCVAKTSVRLVQENHANLKLHSNSFSRNVNWQRRRNRTAKSANVKVNAGKIKSFFVIREALWAEKRGCCLEYCRSWKNLRLRSILKASDGGHFCPLWLWFSNQFDIVSETPYSCDTVGRELWWVYFVRCCALKRTGTFASDRLRVFFNSAIILRLRKVEFFMP